MGVTRESTANSSDRISIGRDRVTFSAFAAAMMGPSPLDLPSETRQILQHAHNVVLDIAGGDAPVYGLNTGLGANLGHRIPPDEISGFQHQIIAGRAVACGAPLSPEISRAVVLARIISAGSGVSGMSLGLMEHLCAVYESGLAPVVPNTGSIGASDLVQNAHMARAILGEGDVWQDGARVAASHALREFGLRLPVLQPKDGLALINHSGVTVAHAGSALARTARSIGMMRMSIALSFEGFAANTAILSEEANQLRRSPGQSEAAAQLRSMLQGSQAEPRRVQEALSFRTVAVYLGAAQSALAEAIDVFEDELNGSADSPAILESGQAISTANYMSPALGLSLEKLGLSLVALGHGSLQRMQRMMDPGLSGLTRFLSADEGRAAGLVPTQKTAAALYAEIRNSASPAIVDVPPVSEAVEDMAPMTAQAAQKLNSQATHLEYLSALEALCACQAIDLRGAGLCAPETAKIYANIREKSPFVDKDRALDADVDSILAVLSGLVSQRE